MKPSLFDFITRWRHTLGYGVHSPLAYKLITECIHPDGRYAYYIDSRIQSVSSGYDERRYMRLLVRLIHKLWCKVVWMPDADKKIVDVIAEAFPGIEVRKGWKMPKNADFIAFFNTRVSGQIFSQLRELQDSFAILSYHSGRRGESPVGIIEKDCKECTLLLSGKTFDLMVRRPGMQRVEYGIL